MSSYLYTWNPKRWNWKDLQCAIYDVNNDEPYDGRWSCGNTKRIKVGDLFFLMRLGVEPKGIIGCGYVLSKPYEQPHWDQKRRRGGRTALYTDLLFEILSENPIFPLEFLQSEFPNDNWTPQSGGANVKDDTVSSLLSYMQNDTKFEFSQKSEEDIHLYINTSDSFDSKVAARVLQFYSCVNQRNQKMEVPRATASECTCDVTPNQETATKIHRPSAGACADAAWPCHVS